MSLVSPAERADCVERHRRSRAAARRGAELVGRLSTRERQVLARLAAGVPASAIATEFVVSLATVRAQIRSVLAKLEVNSQLAAVALAHQVGLDAR
jgi:DNA-binding NarL/FixJ family response regulator